MKISLSFLFCFLSFYSFAQFDVPTDIATCQVPEPNLSLPADLDGDGDLDVVIVSRIDGHIYWYENDGTGNFSNKKVIINNINVVSDIAQGDFDNDGDTDLAVSDHFNREVFLLRNDGAGNFGEKEIIQEDTVQAISIAAADLDNDNDLDLVFSNYFSRDIMVTLNTGMGSFDVTTPISTDSSRPGGISIADINNDGVLDLIYTTNPSSELIWYLGHGNGSFSNKQVIAQGYLFLGNTIAEDFNGDGYSDVVAVHGTQGGISLFLNLGNGFWDEIQLNQLTYQGIDLAAADFDNDGDLDIVTNGGGTSKNLLIKNLGGGTFSEPEFFGGPNISFSAISTADFNGDALPDVLSTSRLDNSVTLYLNSVSGLTFSQNIIEDNGGRGILMADVDNDDNIDLLSFDLGINKNVWYENDDMGDFVEKHHFHIPLGNIPSHIDYQDIDGDLEKDFISYTDGIIRWHKGLGNGNFGVAYQLLVTSSSNTPSFAAEDIDNDGDVDLVFAGLKPQDEFQKIYAYINDGTGVFTEITLIEEGFEEANFDMGEILENYQKLYFSDIDSDGDADLIATTRGYKNNTYKNKILVFKNEGTLVFSEKEVVVNIASGYRKYDFNLKFKDLDGDSTPDLVVNSKDRGPLLYLANDGLGNYSSQIPLIDIIGELLAMDVGDIDADGDLDILVYHVEENKLVWLENLGEGEFTDWENSITIAENLPFEITEIKIQDLNGDEKPEIIYQTTDDGIFYIKNLIDDLEMEDDDESDELVSSYPNPFTNELTFDFSENEEAIPTKLYITNPQGETLEVIDIESNTITINTTSYAFGIYYYAVEDENGEQIAEGTIVKLE